MSRPTRHPKTGIFQLRKRVPDALRSIVGQSEVKISLGTRDPNEAKLRLIGALAELEQRWANLQAGCKSLNEREAHEMVADAYDWWIELHSENPSQQKLWRTDLYQYLWQSDDLAELLQLTVGRPGEPDKDLVGMENFCRMHIADLLKSEGLSVDGEGRRKLENALGAAIQQASLVLASMARGEFPRSFAAQRPVSLTVAPEPSVASDPVYFDRLLEGWKRERRPAEKTVYEYERAFRDLAAHLGHSDASLIKVKDLVAWKEKMLEAGLRVKTIRDAKLSAIRAVLEWGVRNDLLAANPAERIKIDVKKKAGETKRGFDDREAAIILRAARRERNPVRRWIPFIGAYSGARLSEICQLRKEDIAEIEGHWCMKFTPEAGSLKTLGSERVVPLHPALLKEGFLDFAQKAKAGPLFAELSPDKFGKRGGNGTKMIGRWVRGLGLTDERLSPSHSWRHRFKTLGRRLDLKYDVVNAITGHAPKSVADSYGESTVDAMFAQLCKIPEVKLD